MLVATLFPLPDNHHQRFTLHNEVHARASIILELPVRCSHLALLLTHDEKMKARAHLGLLCNRFGINPPHKEADHFVAKFDGFQLRWEQHAEFISYTFYVADILENPFDAPALEQVPVDWLAELPGKVMVATHASIMPTNDLCHLETISSYFSRNPVVGADVSGGAGQAFTDFRIHVDGFSRFLIIDHSLKTQQAGRLLQRLFEIEVYRVMALLAFPIAKRLIPKINQGDQRLLAITEAMSKDERDDGLLLDELTTLAAEVENHISSNHFRFGAANAYYKLVGQRIADLRENRIQGIQTIGEFMQRRLEPAINTCQITDKRFALLSKRISNTSQLLRTRVDMNIERQNQALLTSMDLRAKMQLRLQETVEGVSIVAITSYVVSLMGLLSGALKKIGWNIEPEVISGFSIPVVLIIVALGVRRVHRMIQKEEHK
ncbi:MAG: DUF3422 domain-containing protein [Methylococcales bacterium]|nr:DUF3422 domain-containing protein [Methylococcales bacterium]